MVEDGQALQQLLAEQEDPHSLNLHHHRQELDNMQRPPTHAQGSSQQDEQRHQQPLDEPWAQLQQPHQQLQGLPQRFEGQLEEEEERALAAHLARWAARPGPESEIKRRIADVLTQVCLTDPLRAVAGPRSSSRSGHVRSSEPSAVGVYVGWRGLGDKPQTRLPEAALLAGCHVYLAQLCFDISGRAPSLIVSDLARSVPAAAWSCMQH